MSGEPSRAPPDAPAEGPGEAASAEGSAEAPIAEVPAPETPVAAAPEPPVGTEPPPGPIAPAPSAAAPAEVAPPSPPPPPATAAPPVAAPPSGTPPSTRLVHAMAYEVVVAVYVSIAVTVIAFVALGGRFHDLYLHLRPSAPTSGEVALLTIGEEAFYLWDPTAPRPERTPRPMLAELVRFLHAAGAKVIVLDVLLDEPADGDDALAAAMDAHGAVVVAERFVDTEPKSGLSFVPGTSVTLGDAATPAFANLPTEEPLFFSGQMLVRHALLVRRVSRARLAGRWPENAVGGEQAEGLVLPSLALTAAILQRADDPRAAAERLLRDLQTRCGGSPLACDGGAAAFGLPATPEPLTAPLTINWRGDERRDGLPVVRAAQALRLTAETALIERLGGAGELAVPADVAAAVAGKLIVVGRVDGVDEAASDRFVTPWAFPIALRPDMAGCRVHAQIADTLLSGRHLRPIDGAAVWIAALVAGALVAATRHRLSPPAHAAGWLGAGVGAFALGAVTFRVTDGVAIDLGPPLGVGLLVLTATHLWGWSKEGAG